MSKYNPSKKVSKVGYLLYDKGDDCLFYDKNLHSIHVSSIDVFDGDIKVFDTLHEAIEFRKRFPLYDEDGNLDERLGTYDATEEFDIYYISFSNVIEKI